MQNDADMAAQERELRIQAHGLLMQAEMLAWEHAGCFAARGAADYHRIQMEKLIAERSPGAVARMALERGLPA